MKKRMSLIVMCAALLVLTACGKEKTAGSNDAGKQTESAADAGQEKESAVSKDGILLGVYEGATECIPVPMGAYYEGEQKNFCRIDMPIEYLISASYSEDGLTEILNTDIYGIKVETLKTKNIEEQDVANQWILINSVGGTEMHFVVLPTSIRTMDDVKEQVDDYKELNNAGYNAIYYVDQNQYATADLNMYYQLNENWLLAISYEGPVADEIGLDQLAQNLYDLVEVIE